MRNLFQINGSAKAKCLMLSVSFVWGASYLLMKMALAELPYVDVVAWRFLIAFSVLFYIFFRNAIQISKQIMWKSSVLGFFLFLLYISLVFGVERTSASNAGFLSSTTVIIVPIIDCILKKYLPSKQIVFSIIIVLIGLYLLIIKKNLIFDSGTIYCLGAALFYAIYIICSDRLNVGKETLAISIWQLGFTGLFSVIFSCIRGSFLFIPKNKSTWIAIFMLAIICTAYSFIAQSTAQKYLKPEVIGVFFSLEPIFSAFLSWLILHEVLSVRAYLGAFVIVIGVLFSQYNFHHCLSIFRYRETKIKE